MAKLVLKFHDAILQEFLLGEKPITIGRTDENDIVIKNLGVSRRHALITKEGENYFLQDLESRNGTLLHDKLIDKKTMLDEGDEIGIGKHCLLFSLQEAEVPPTPAARAIEPPSISKTSKFPSLLSLPDETVRMPILKEAETAKMPTLGDENIQTKKLLSLDERQKGNGGKTQPLEVKKYPGVEILRGSIKQNIVRFSRSLTVAGKGATADIRIKGDYDKDVVFIINTRTDGCFVSPPKGVPVLVNGSPIKDYTKLVDGDLIEAGETAMKFFSERV